MDAEAGATDATGVCGGRMPRRMKSKPGRTRNEYANRGPLPAPRRSLGMRRHALSVNRMRSLAAKKRMTKRGKERDAKRTFQEAYSLTALEAAVPSPVPWPGENSEYDKTVSCGQALPPVVDVPPVRETRHDSRVPICAVAQMSIPAAATTVTGNAVGAEGLGGPARDDAARQRNQCATPSSSAAPSAFIGRFSQGERRAFLEDENALWLHTWLHACRQPAACERCRQRRRAAACAFGCCLRCCPGDGCDRHWMVYSKSSAAPID